jgi:G3E family GTPase
VLAPAGMGSSHQRVALVVLAGFGVVGVWLWSRARRAPRAEADKRVPVTLLTGFLGAGKTTLFNHVLTASHGKKIAVIQNEFGEVGIDNRLMAKQTEVAQTEEIVEVLNGCVCCSVRTDLIQVLKKLAARQQAGELCLDAIVIETTGMANPAPVVQTLLVEDDVRAFARLDGVVTLVDAKHIEQHLDERKGDGVVNESVCQVAFADRLLLNKVDLLPDDAALERVEARLRGINSFAPIRRCTWSNVGVQEVLGIAGFDLQRTLAQNPGFMDPSNGPTQHDALVSRYPCTRSNPGRAAVC